MNNKDLVVKFYTAFSEGNAKSMTECYHHDVVFQDPAFGKLTGDRAKNMWHMLLSNKTNDSGGVTFKNIIVNDSKVSAEWRAEYLFGEKKRPVVNNVTANFKFRDGKIIEHIDDFDVWTWSKQALGLSGLLLGWTSFLKNKIQQNANAKLDEYINLK